VRYRPRTARSECQSRRCGCLAARVVSELKLRCVLHEQHTKGQEDRAALALQEIVEGVEAKVGEQFFASLVQQLAATLGVDYTYVSELDEDGTRPRSNAGWGKGRPLPPFNGLERGPCKIVLTCKCVHHWNLDVGIACTLH
jgi:hypothetical protein